MAKVYVAGLMTGYPELNHPAFAKASAALRAMGFEVVSPAELNPIETPYIEAMKNDIRVLVDCDHILMLDGWEKSKGASLEYHIASVLGIPEIVLALNPSEEFGKEALPGLAYQVESGTSANMPPPRPGHEAIVKPQKKMSRRERIVEARRQQDRSGQAAGRTDIDYESDELPSAEFP